MDMHMPEMDGPEATRAIRALGGTASQIPIIGLSADAMTEQMDQHMAAGLDGYLTKPLDQTKLRALVARTKAHPAPAPRPAATPSAAAGIEDSLIDESQVEEIRAAVGDEMLSELFVAFCQDVRTEFDRVIAACHAKDRSALVIAAHTLRGVAGNLGAARIAKLATALESAATGDSGRVIDETLVDNLTTAVERTIEVLSRRV